MLRDWGSRDADFIAITRRIQDWLLAIAGVESSHVAVPVQGSGTFGVEATLGTLIAPGQRTLVLENGAYGKRIVTILERIGREVATLSWPEDQVVDPTALDAALGTVKLTDFTMQLLQSVGSKSLIVRCGVGMFHPSKDEIYVNLTAPQFVLHTGH